MGWGTILSPCIVALRVCGLDPWQHSVPQDLVLGLCADSLSWLKKERGHLLAVLPEDAQNHNLGWMLGPENPLDLSWCC